MLRPVAAAAPLAALAALAAAAHAATPMKTARARDVTIRVPADWKVTRKTGAVRLVAESRNTAAGFFSSTAVSTGPARSAGMAAWRRAIVASIRKMPTGRGTLTSQIVRIPAGRAIRITLRGTGKTRDFRWLIYVVDARPKSYVLTFTVGAKEWARRASQYVTMAHSFRIRR